MLKRLTVLGVGFDTLSYSEIQEFLLIESNRRGYVCFPDLYNILRARNDSSINKIFNKSTLTLPDGFPAKVILRIKGRARTQNISGYWLCKLLLETECSHYFYGSSESTLAEMRRRFQLEYPKAKILGYSSPPFLPESEIVNSVELGNEIDAIKELKPNFVWIGISSPKQDLLMSRFSSQNEGTIFLGVGAVFDYFSGQAYMGPEWLKKIGLRWLYQFLRDPKRYGSRLWYIFREAIKLLFKQHK